MDVRVLLYHALYDKEANHERHAISQKEFKSHIRYLIENGLRKSIP